ncbi:epidermal growth factor-like protein [Stomoxys calcitrans]|uniref:epidermal growth factor-like protein n=1 Tax=Stomoxys calcitrans TaxID=35570 RepID=UPI0027E3AC5E|nr:epidermal growth factor-like protein [Stomoxys calcitrans]
MTSERWGSFQIHVRLVGFYILVTATVKGQDQEIYGDIYPNTRAELNLYYNTQHREEKCYRDVPAIFFQFKEEEPIMGNSSIPNYLRFEKCCEGYVATSRPLDLDSNKCVPDCSLVSANNCRNGFCRSSQHCECFEGFVANSKGNCVHTCPLGCENGHCLLDGTCICNPGYSLESETRKFCIPQCSHIPCGLNQECVAPGECQCQVGYQWLDFLGCQPICQPGCGFGRCGAPQECECFAGYIKRPGRNICEAECKINCLNGFCESFYKCQCFNGFVYDSLSQTCLPHCPDSCEHGVCIAPGICRCFEGYYLWDNICRPICENGCGPYGKCVKPNTCACGSGQQHCLGGDQCTSEGKCRCPFGMQHFIDRCLYPFKVQSKIFTTAERLHYDKELKYEFEALIGRFFQF